MANLVMCVVRLGFMERHKRVVVNTESTSTGTNHPRVVMSRVVVAELMSRLLLLLAKYTVVRVGSSRPSYSWP